MNSEVARFEPCFEYLVGPDFPEPAVVDFVSNMVARHQEPWRHYHVVDHPVDVTGFLVANVERLKNPRPTIITGIGHDAVYIPQAPKYVNEERTAELLEYMLTPYLPVQEVEAIGSNTRASARHDHELGNTDLSLFLDGDLKILGAPEDEFEAYDTGIEKEYYTVDRATFLLARHRILRNIFFRDRIFVTDVAYEQFELPARVNLARKLMEIASQSSEGLEGWNQEIEERLERWQNGSI